MFREDMPFFYGLIDYAANGIIPFHTPGHKQGRGIHPTFKRAMLSGLDLDVSDVLEAPEYDNSWSKALQAAQELAAKAFGAKHTRFLVNGTSGGIHAMFLAARALGYTSIVMPRFSHLSAYSGLALSGLEPIFLEGSVLGRWNLPLPPKGEEYTALMDERSLVFSTYPNYYGIGVDLSALVDVVRNKKSYLLVDEAHGPHYAFHPLLPPPALKSGADLCAQSTHKVLGALTQASMLHIGSRFKVEYIDKALNLVGTTSPSALLLASLDAARSQMESGGKRLWQKAIELAQSLKERITMEVGLPVLDSSQLPEGFFHDPTRIVIYTGSKGITGLKAANKLRSKGVQVELADTWHIILIITWADTTQSINTFIHAIKEVMAEEASNSCEEIEQSLEVLPIPKRVVGYRQAVFAPSEKIPLVDSVGHVSAEVICPYPPGVPILSPGEMIDDRVIYLLKRAIHNAVEVRGITDPTLESIHVLI